MPIKTPPPRLTASGSDDDNKSNNDKRIIDELIKSVLGLSPIDTDEPMTVEQVTAYLGYKDVHVVLKLIRRKELKAHKVGKKWLIWKSDLIAYINSR